MRTGAGRKVKGLQGLPEGGLLGHSYRLVKMDTENIIQCNIRGVKSNFEDLKLMLTKLNILIVALQDCRLGEEQGICSI